MKYAVISHSSTPPTVLSTHWFGWVACLAASLYSRFSRHDRLDIATVDLRAQVLINACVNRDGAMEQRDAAVEILANLVARDDAGLWTTVHDADVVVERQADISRILA